MDDLDATAMTVDEAVLTTTEEEPAVRRRVHVAAIRRQVNVPARPKGTKQRTNGAPVKVPVKYKPGETRLPIEPTKQQREDVASCLSETRRINA